MCAGPEKGDRQRGEPPSGGKAVAESWDSWVDGVILPGTAVSRDLQTSVLKLFLGSGASVLCSGVPAAGSQGVGGCTQTFTCFSWASLPQGLTHQMTS